MGMSDHSSNQNAYRRYLELYIQLCRKYKDTGETCASMRMAWNLPGGILYERGRIYAGRRCFFQQALKAEASDEEISMLSTIDIQSNLLLIYYVQNDRKGISAVG